jgi:hypothetical protein
MPVLVHKNHYISVHTTPDTFDKTLFVPKVDISSNDGRSILKITTIQAFADESDAEVCGFEMGKKWIDKQH